MKKKFLNGSLNFIKTKDPTVSEERLEIIAYGLEPIYLTWTKMVIIFSLAFLLGIVKEVVLLLICYNLIRSSAFGIHATKSIYCLISSLCMFVGGVYVCEYLSISLIVKIIVSIVCVICLFKYAPADTEKRPLINAKKRKRYKILSTLVGIIFTILIIKYNNNVISNYLFIGMIESVLMIHPLVYKLFNLPYDNYKNYDCVV